jgi:hypothetical protein
MLASWPAILAYWREGLIMKAYQILIVIVTLTTVAALSGCICCCGIDGMFSKLKSPVSAIKFPSTINLNGKILNKIYSNDYLNPDAVKNGLKNFAGKLGYQVGSDISDSVNSLIDASGINQYKSFKYSDGTEKGTVGGMVGKTDSPVQVMAGFEAMKTTSDAAMSSVNDPDQNEGSVSDVYSSGSSSVGDGGERYTFQVNGQNCYGVIVKYSNTYVMAYSFESFAAAEAAAEMAIEQIDAVASQ